ncbi:uncharacterized protein F5147DRAFT_658329 [Suillus discolor]|uniref:Uncharacterized protein n=1 Tax=Suillus discolor TaxID=1912936 RepID=A0A9P7ETE0_9AGAM|nr:uncharacterized protein F5147DRAFT_658329 [Suillus discolor]KAG2089728.1 hypothetical protein F5147DRAFT_658329 [Suillus discolor]
MSRMLNGCFISRRICTFWIVSDIDILEAGRIGFVGPFNREHQDLQPDGDQQYPKTANGRIRVKKVLLVSGSDKSTNTNAVPGDKDPGCPYGCGWKDQTDDESVPITALEDP